MASTPHPRLTRRTRTLASLAALPIGLLVVLGAGLALASPSAAATHSVVIKQFAYSPASLSVDVGDTVTWTNQDSVGHDVTVAQGPASFHSPLLAKGQSWSHTFTTAGSYSYICSVHPDMKASVTVHPAATPTPKKTASRHPAPADVPATTSSPAAGTGGQHVAQPSSAPKAPAATQVAAPTASQDVVTPVQEAGSTLSPLLLVAGASTAVMVFCLLLLTSRPAVRETEPPVGDPATG
jgi:plastocyanin